MVTAIVGLVAMASVQVPPRQDRIAFFTALKQVEDGWSLERVRSLLGPPDDVWPIDDRYRSVLFWAYGSTYHRSQPLLGLIEFEKGVVSSIYTDLQPAPPPLGVISDEELFRHLRAMYRPREEDYRFYDPLYVVRTVNQLWPLGKEKALAVLNEYSRLDTEYETTSDLVEIAHLLFVPKDPPGYFEFAGSSQPLDIAKMRQWPEYPVLAVDNVPFLVGSIGGGFSGGLPYKFWSYAEPFRIYGKLRLKPIRPPDDPFLAIEKANRSPLLANLAYQRDRKRDFLDQTKDLVRTVWRQRLPVEPTDEDHEETFEQVHQRFLDMKPHWDERRQIYVRSDGTFLEDGHRDFTMRYCHFSDAPGIKLTVRMERGPERQVNMTTSCRFAPSQNLPPARLTVINVDTGAKLCEIAVNEKGNLFVREDGTQDVGRETSFLCLLGTRLRPILEFDAKQYEGDILVP